MQALLLPSTSEKGVAGIWKDFQQGGSFEIWKACDARCRRKRTQGTSSCEGWLGCQMSQSVSTVSCQSGELGVQASVRESKHVHM